MTPGTGTDLVCFGFLAYAQVLTVAAYPLANSGIPIHEIFSYLAGDAPIAALTGRRLGTRAH
jgi:hypothetical protein